MQNIVLSNTGFGGLSTATELCRILAPSHRIVDRAEGIVACAHESRTWVGQPRPSDLGVGPLSGASGGVAVDWITRETAVHAVRAVPSPATSPLGRPGVRYRQQGRGEVARVQDGSIEPSGSDGFARHGR